MAANDAFDLRDFLPYLLNQAAEKSSLEFRQFYKDSYDMLRTEWRVLFHLGRYGDITAKEICTRARIHKTKVSRAVAALEKKRFLTRSQMNADRRQEKLSLTPTGMAAFNDLYKQAREFDAAMMRAFSPTEQELLRKCLIRIAKF